MKHTVGDLFGSGGISRDSHLLMKSKFAKLPFSACMWTGRAIGMARLQGCKMESVPTTPTSAQSVATTPTAREPRCRDASVNGAIGA
jgi:hypothetical protein